MTILITGATRGIGLTLARALAAQGEPVLATHRGPRPAPEPGVTWHPLDVTDPAGPAALAATLGDRAIDSLICNAGVLLDRGQDLATGYAAPLWADTFATNVTGVFLTVQALLPHLSRAAAPKIGILSSAMGSDARAPGGSYIYRASKAAVLNLGRNLATDLAPRGIAVGIWHPGWVRTDMGGPGAEIDVDTSAAGLIARLRALTPATTGRFESFDGTPIPF